MTRAAQRHTKNSVQGALLAFSKAEVSIPAVIQPMFQVQGFKDEWDAMTSCRTPDNWKDWELCEVAEICREKLEIAELEAAALKEGKVQVFPNGAQAPHPAWKMAQELKKSYMSRIRLIGIHDVKQQARSNGAVAAGDVSDEAADLI